MKEPPVAGEVERLPIGPLDSNTQHALSALLVSNVTVWLNTYKFKNTCTCSHTHFPICLNINSWEHQYVCHYWKCINEWRYIFQLTYLLQYANLNYQLGLDKICPEKLSSMRSQTEQNDKRWEFTRNGRCRSFPFSSHNSLTYGTGSVDVSNLSQNECTRTQNQSSSFILIHLELFHTWIV